MLSNIKELAQFSRTLKILFVEDNYDVRIQLIKLLENFFSHIDVEANGLDALKKTKEFKKQTGNYYDLIVTDLSMPKMDGVEFCEKIIQINQKQLILVISAHTESKKLQQLEDIGVYKFLQKPVNYKDFLNAIILIIEKLKKQDKQ